MGGRRILRRRWGRSLGKYNNAECEKQERGDQLFHDGLVSSLDGNYREKFAQLIVFLPDFNASVIFLKRLSLSGFYLALIGGQLHTFALDPVVYSLSSQHKFK
jgi:hypothetical protein